MEVLSQAEAKRRLLIISDCSDCKLKPRDRTRRYARQASQCGAEVVVIGERVPDGAQGFLRFEDAAEFLRRELRAGDLALLRGRACDHLSRLYFALLGEVNCHVPTCDSRRPCDECARLGFTPAAGSVCAE